MLNRYRSLRAAGTACIVMAAVFCFTSSFGSATPLLVDSDAAQSAQNQYLTRLDGVNAPNTVSSWAGRLDSNRGVLAQDELDKLFYLPLAFKNYHRLAPWSGTARFGFDVAGVPLEEPVEDYDVSLLHADWYVYFTFRPDPPLLPSVEYAQSIELSEGGYSPSRAQIEEYARSQSGQLWIIGNEPDAVIQDCVTPARYAELYHDLYYIIKGADPTAKVAIAGVVQGTPLRLQYLDMVLDAYQDQYGGKIPVDVWNVHAFILREKKGQWGCQIPCGIAGVQQGMLYTVNDHDNMTIFKQQIRRFRRWMKDQGERNKPLIVTEYGILLSRQHGFDEARVERFMLSTFDFFRTATSSTTGYPADGNKLVQAWAWYSLNDKNFEGWETYNHLFDPDTKQITRLGRAYGDYMGSIP